MRARHRPEGLARLRSALARFGVDAPTLERLSEEQIVCGGLSDPQPWMNDPRLVQCTHVVNCGASTAFSQETMAWTVNCEDTLEFVSAAARYPGLQRFLHVGTAMSCGPDREKLVAERWEFAPRERHLVAYTASKAAFEAEVRARYPDLPLVVAQIGRAHV